MQDDTYTAMPKVVGARGRMAVDFVPSEASAATGQIGATADTRPANPEYSYCDDDDRPALEDIPHDPATYHPPVYSTTGDVDSSPVCGFVTSASDVRHTVMALTAPGVL